MKEDDIIDTIKTVLISVTSSTIFLLIISRLKPKISICDKIACSYERKDGHDKQIYFFKIINKSWFYKTYDINIRAFTCENMSSQNGENIFQSPIEFRKNYQWVLNRMHRRHFFQDFRFKSGRLDGRTDYAAQFSTFDNLKNSISQNKFITFEIIARHSLTGFSVVKTRSYKHIGEIIKGNFLSGNSFEVLETNSID